MISRVEKEVMDIPEDTLENILFTNPDLKDRLRKCLSPKMIAALFVETNGVYFGLHRVDPPS